VVHIKYRSASTFNITTVAYNPSTSIELDAFRVLFLPYVHQKTYREFCTQRVTTGTRRLTKKTERNRNKCERPQKRTRRRHRHVYLLTTIFFSLLFVSARTTTAYNNIHIYVCVCVCVIKYNII
jgi:hypothetical protein